jgi:hypothetical protein
VLLLVGYGLLHTTTVQNWLVHKVAGTLSKELGTKVSIKKVDFSLFNKMQLEGAYVEDKYHDTLLYAGRVEVQITDWFFTKEKAVLETVSLEDAKVYLHRKDSIWNYHHIAQYFSSPSSGKPKKGIKLQLKKLQLLNINLVQRDEWRGEDLALQLHSLQLTANEIDFNKKLADIATIKIMDPVFSVYNYRGSRPKRARVIDTTVTTYTSLRWNQENWKVLAKLITIENGALKSDQQTTRAVHYFFDETHILFSSIHARFSDVRFEKDTVQGQLQLRTKERSGFEV